MKITNQLKGFLLAFFSTIAVSYGYIYSKAALNEIDIFHFGLYWFGFAIIWNLLFIVKIRKKINLKTINKQGWWAIAGNTFFEVIGSTLFYIAIQNMENPTIVSFLINLGSIFILIMGYLWLKEKFNLFEYAGIIITLIGIFLINYHTDTKISGSSITGAWLVVASTFFISVAVIIAKIAVKKIQPVILTSGRILVLFTLSFVILIIKGSSFHVSGTAIINVAIGSFTGTFLSLLSMYYSLKYIEASFVSIISSTKSLFLIILTYIFFSQQITKFQLIAGVITIIGVMLISAGKKMLVYFQHLILKREEAKIS
jgi:drug/metabolite transporter (DMT)-like permease